MDGGLFIGFSEGGKPMKRYFLLGCIVAITPIMQSVSANAADFFGPGIAPRAPYVPPRSNWSGGAGWGGGGWGGCGCCCGGWSSSGWSSVRWSSGGWSSGGWGGGGWGGGGWGGGDWGGGGWGGGGW